MNEKKFSRLATRLLFLKEKIGPFPWIDKRCPYCNFYYQTIKFGFYKPGYKLTPSEAEFYICEFYKKGLLGNCIKCQNPLVFEYNNIKKYESGKNYVELPKDWQLYSMIRSHNLVTIAELKMFKREAEEKAIKAKLRRIEKVEALKRHIAHREKIGLEKRVGYPWIDFLKPGETIECPEKDFVFPDYFDWNFEDLEITYQEKKDILYESVAKTENFLAVCPKSGRWLRINTRSKTVTLETYKNTITMQQLFGEEVFNKYQGVLRSQSLL